MDSKSNDANNNISTDSFNVSAVNTCVVPSVTEEDSTIPKLTTASQDPNVYFKDVEEAVNDLLLPAIEELAIDTAKPISTMLESINFDTKEQFKSVETVKKLIKALECSIAVYEIIQKLNSLISSGLMIPLTRQMITNLKNDPELIDVIKDELEGLRKTNASLNRAIATSVLCFKYADNMFESIQKDFEDDITDKDTVVVEEDESEELTEETSTTHKRKVIKLNL